MKMPSCFLALFLAFVIASCSSEPEESIGPATDDEIETSGSTAQYRDSSGPWNVSEDDNRTRLGPCGLKVAADGNVTGISASWSMPGNGSSNTLFRLELAEDGNFTTGYLAFAGLVETVYQVSNLKPNTQYFVRLQAYQSPHDENNPQVYLGTEENNESSADSQVRTFAPSEPEIADATTIRNALLHPTNIELTIGHGKFSAKWDHPANASGKLEYVVGVYSDEDMKTALDIRLLKKPMVKDWIVEPGFDYWLRVQALPDPDSTNQSDGDSHPMVKQFHVPGNQLDAPANFKVAPTENTINLSWDPIENNSQDFEYLLMAHLDEDRNESFGEYHLDVPRLTILGVNQAVRYWFDLQAVPASGNHADTASETVSLLLELPTITYAAPKISDLKMEPIDDVEEPGTIIKLAWEGSANGDGQHKYRVEIADDKEFVAGFQDYEEGADAVGAEIGPLDPGRTYFLRMRAVGPPDDETRSNSEWSEIKTFVTPGEPLPAAPIE